MRRSPTTPAADDYPSLVEAKDGTLWTAYQAYTEGVGDQVLVRQHVERRVVGRRAAHRKRRRCLSHRHRAGRRGPHLGGLVRAGGIELRSLRPLVRRQALVARRTPDYGRELGYLPHARRRCRRAISIWPGRARAPAISISTCASTTASAWSKEIQVSDDPANDWEPALAVAPDGAVTIVWDTYAQGQLRRGGAHVSQGDARPADVRSPLAAPWSRAPPRNTIARAGCGWRGTRAIGTGARTTATRFRKAAAACSPAAGSASACWRTAACRKPPRPSPTPCPRSSGRCSMQPLLILDGGGNPWVFFRVRTNTPQGYEGRTIRSAACGAWKPPRCATAAGRP